MDGALIALWITTGVAVVGTGYNMVRNGSRRKEQDIQLKTELKLELRVIKEQLEDPDNGLEAIKKATDDQKNLCTKLSTELGTEVANNKKEIDRLRDKK